MTLAHGISGISCADVIESEARSIQQGGSEYVFSKQYLDLCWPADEYILVELTAEGTFDAFDAAAGKLLDETPSARHGSLPIEVSDEAVRLNHALVHQPFASRNNPTLNVRCDLPGGQAELRETPVVVDIDVSAGATTISRNGAARSSGGATIGAPISIRRP